MKITDYIVLGGENLNDPPQKTPDFTAEAEQVFKTNCFSLGSSDHNLESWLELPVNDCFRLFIRMFWMERRGQRALCYYIGLQLPKRLYLEAGDFYRVNKGISLLTLETILSALDNASPIEVPLVPQPQSAIGSSFEELCKLKLFGTEKFSENMEKMRLSISINSIDDWFNRLRVAVNPSRPPKGRCLLVAKQGCEPSFPESTPKELSQESTLQRKSPLSWLDNRKSVYAASILFFLLGSFCGTLLTGPRIKSLNEELKEKEKAIQQGEVEFKQQQEDFSQEIKKKEKTIKNMEDRIKRLEKIVDKLVHNDANTSLRLQHTKKAKPFSQNCF